MAILNNCVNPLEMSRAALVWRELNNFGSIDRIEFLIRPVRSTKPPSLPSVLMPWESSLENIFSPKALADNFQNSNCVEYSGFGVTSLEWTKISFTKCCHAYLPGWQRWRGWVTKAWKCYIQLLAKWIIRHKLEYFDQSKCFIIIFTSGN